MAKKERAYAFEIIRHAELQSAAEATTREQRIAHLSRAGFWQVRARNLALAA